MKKLTVRLVFIVVGGTLGLTYLPFLWAMILSQPNVLLNNVFTNFLLGALLLWVLSSVSYTHLTLPTTERV